MFLNAIKLISELEEFPLMCKCLKGYIEWLCNQPNVNLEENDLMFWLCDQPTADLAKIDIDSFHRERKRRLQQLEDCFLKCQQLLRVSWQQFCSIFGFKNDLRTTDPEKIHDILAELLLVVALDGLGFTQIKKLPQFIKHSDIRLPNADFSAQCKGFRFAIEVKTIRTENKPKPKIGELIGNSMVPSWWCTMFQNNIETKIKDKNQRVLKQLKNALKKYKCDYTMFAIYNCRCGTSWLNHNCYIKVIPHIHHKYKNSIDFYIIKDDYSEAFLYPELPNLINQD